MKRLVFSFAFCATILPNNVEGSTIKFDELSHKDRCEIIKIQIKKHAEQGSKVDNTIISDYIKTCSPTLLMS